MIKKNEVLKYNYTLLVVIVLLAVIGIIAIYSAGFDPIDKLNNGMYKRQIFWFTTGFVLMMGMTFINHKILSDYCHYIYAVNLIIIILVAFFAEPIRNTRAWINFGFFSIQPSEFMKISYIIMLAKYLELREREMMNFVELIIPALITIIPVAFIIKQPDFGTAMLFIPVLFIMLYAGGADIWHLVSIVLIAVLSLLIPMVITFREWSHQDTSVFIDFFNSGSSIYVVSISIFFIGMLTYLINLVFVKQYLKKIYFPAFILSLGLLFSVIIQRYLKDYQKKRILVFLSPELDPLGSGYNVIQSKIAIGSGGFFGKGFLKGTQSQLGFLPEKTSDFIFAAISEEWGFIGSVFVVVLFGLLVFEGIKIAITAKDKFSSLSAVGITSIFFSHFVINVGMVMGITPVTGIPLCFISYGGSNLLMAMISVGILLSIQQKKTVN